MILYLKKYNNILYALPILIFGISCKNDNPLTSSNRGAIASQSPIIYEQNDDNEQILDDMDDHAEEKDTLEDDNIKFDTFFDDILDDKNILNSTNETKNNEEDKQNDIEEIDATIDEETQEIEINTDKLNEMEPQQNHKLVIDDNEGKDIDQEINVSNIHDNKDINKLKVPIENDEQDSPHFVFFPRVGLDNKETKTEDESEEAEIISNAKISTSKKLWNSLKAVVENPKKEKAFKDTVFISLVCAPTRNHEFEHENGNTIILESYDLHTNGNSVVNNSKKSIGSKVNVPLILYEKPKSSIFKKNKDQSCKLEGGECSHVKANITRRPKSKWDKTKKWRKLDIKIEPDKIKNILNEKIEISGDNSKSVKEWIEYIRDNKPKKNFIKHKKDEDRENIKQELSMKILQRLLNQSKLFVTLSSKSKTDQKKYQGVATIHVGIDKSKEDTKNKVKWDLSLKTGPLQVIEK